MFYYLSKVVWFLAVPSNLLPLLALLGVLLGRFDRFRQAGFRLAVFALALLLFCGLGPVANWALLPLEQRFPPFADASRPVDGIIVLGGGAMPEETVARGQIVLNEAGERILALSDLARRYPHARLVFSGGGGTLFRDHVSEAQAILKYAGSLGIDASRLVIEADSRSTAENATYSKKLLAPAAGETWLLVTSAWHMPRAVGCFRRAGFEVIAYPVDYRTRGPEDMVRVFASSSEGLRRFDAAVKEWAGLFAYRLTGRTDALFPAPGK
ncbi:MAG: YdcF family protein [Methylobacteriaceae bacterium]|jgi:uncharacterized SAM-binding protein YcdF (DUF218 family)|nr:YdcF family protein [Methylobacteriaceae bacterium]